MVNLSSMYRNMDIESKIATTKRTSDEKGVTDLWKKCILEITLTGRKFFMTSCASSLTKQVMMRGITIEDLTEPPIFKVLLPLRRAIYARMGLKFVKEKMCSPHDCNSSWCTWVTIKIEDNEPRAPPVPADLEGLLPMACSFLKTTGVVEDYHLRAILCQRTDR